LGLLGVGSSKKKEIKKMKKNLISFLALSLLLTMVIAKPAKAADKGLLSIVGPIVGVPVGAVMGGVRGMTSKGVEYTGSFSKAMGDGFIGRLIGTPTGLIVGGATGGVTGLLHGILHGVTDGIDDPLSAKSASLDGDFIDYDPYELFDDIKLN
jgi:hypothetical protein